MEAQPFYEQAISLYRRVASGTSSAGPTSPATSVASMFALTVPDDPSVLQPMLVTVEKLVALLVSGGEVEGSVGLSEEALVLVRRLHGKDHPLVAPRIRQYVSPWSCRILVPAPIMAIRIHTLRRAWSPCNRFPLYHCHSVPDL